MLTRQGVGVGCKRVVHLLRQEGSVARSSACEAGTTIRVLGIATAPDLVRREWSRPSRTGLRFPQPLREEAMGQREVQGPERASL